jgi:hypothetical protein
LCALNECPFNILTTVKCEVIQKERILTRDKRLATILQLVDSRLNPCMMETINWLIHDRYLSIVSQTPKKQYHTLLTKTKRTKVKTAIVKPNEDVWTTIGADTATVLGSWRLIY